MRSPTIHHPRRRHPLVWVREHFDAWFDQHVAKHYRQIEQAERDVCWGGK
jgi:hypothetical protein